MASPSASSCCCCSSTAPPQSSAVSSSPKYLFGGDRPWKSSQWTASDDRVRGGQSQSYLTVSRVGEGEGGGEGAGGGGDTRAEFSGHLDITTLGGAGFASQRTVDDLCCWDLAGYDALALDVAQADGKRYTVVLKDTTLPRGDDGREQSTVSWEYDFTVGPIGGCGGKPGICSGKTVVTMALADFQPTYRGRAKPDAAPLDLKKVKRITLMMRSFFGDQEGDFSLSINSLSAVASPELRSSRQSASDGTVHDDGGGADGDYVRIDKSEMLDEELHERESGHASRNASWLGWIRRFWCR